jgi:excisionase family DNA binding protein
MSLSHSALDAHPRIERLAYSMWEAAEAIGICERSIWQAIKDGRLRASRIGRSVRISAVDLEQFLEESSRSSTESEVPP